MHLDKHLNLVVPVDREHGPTVYVHSTPIRREIFEAHFLPISKAFARIHAEGLGPISGPRVALLMLRKVSQELGAWDGEGGVEAALIPEIRRLTNVLMPGEAGWSSIPFDLAEKHGRLSGEDAAEVMNAIAFFICASVMVKRRDLADYMGMALQIWGGQTTSLNATEFAASLPTSTGTVSSGQSQTATPLSIPS